MYCVGSDKSSPSARNTEVFGLQSVAQGLHVSMPALWSKSLIYSLDAQRYLI